MVGFLLAAEVDKLGIVGKAARGGRRSGQGLVVYRVHQSHKAGMKSKSGFLSSTVETYSSDSQAKGGDFVFSVVVVVVVATGLRKIKPSGWVVRNSNSMMLSCSFSRL